MNYRRFIALSALAAASLSSLSAAPVLVGNSELAGITLNDSDVEALLLGKTITLGGKRVMIVLAKDSAGQEEFLKTKIGKTNSQFEKHWRRLFMTGGGSIPKSVDSESSLVEKIGSVSGAIGIVDESMTGDLPVLAH